MITNFHNSFRQQRCLPRNGSECELSRHFDGGLRQVLRRMEHLSTLDDPEGNFAFCGKRDLAKFSGYTVRYINGCLEYLIALGLIKPACQTVNGITRRGYVLVDHNKVAKTAKKTCVFVGLGKHESGEENFPTTSQPLPNDFPVTSRSLPDDFPKNGSETSQLTSQVTSQNKSATSLEHNAIEADDAKNVQSFAERFVWEGNESTPLIPVNPLKPSNPPTPTKDGGGGRVVSTSKPNPTDKEMMAEEIYKVMDDFEENTGCTLNYEDLETLFTDCGCAPEDVVYAAMEVILRKKGWDGLDFPEKIFLKEFPAAHKKLLREIAKQKKQEAMLADAKRQMEAETAKVQAENAVKHAEWLAEKQAEEQETALYRATGVFPL
jgi:hypothetical protein